MAKFAVLLLAAFAFHAASAAASAGGLMPYGYPDVSLGDYHGKTDYHGYGFFENYQGYPAYGQELTKFEFHIQTLIRDLHQVFQTTSFEDVTAKQAFVHLVCEYVHHLEYIVEKLHQYVNYTADSDVYIFEQVVQNLRQYVWALKQFHSWEYSSVEMSTHFYMYVQKIAAEFEHLITGFEYTHGPFYNFVYEILAQYVSATHYLYKYAQNIHEYPQYGYDGSYSQQYYGNNYYGGKYFGKYWGDKYGQYYGQQYGRGKYGQQYGYGYGLGHYGQGYGYGYQHQYGYQPYGHYWPYTQYSTYAY